MPSKSMTIVIGISSRFIFMEEYFSCMLGARVKKKQIEHITISPSFYISIPRQPTWYMETKMLPAKQSAEFLFL